MHYFQFRIFISKIKGIFGIFEIMLGAGSKVLGAGSICLLLFRLNQKWAGPKKFCFLLGSAPYHLKHIPNINFKTQHCPYLFSYATKKCCVTVVCVLKPLSFFKCYRGVLCYCVCVLNGSGGGVVSCNSDNGVVIFFCNSDNGAHFFSSFFYQ